MRVIELTAFRYSLLLLTCLLCSSQSWSGTMLRLVVLQGPSGTVKLSWNANSESDLAGYRLHYGNTSKLYSNKVATGNVTTYSLVLLPGTYFFALTAFDTSANESPFSNEVTATILGTTPPPLGDWIPLVNFGSSAAGNVFGSAWSTVIKDAYTDYVASGPGGTAIVVGDNGSYNYQGVSGASRAFSAGEKIRVTWYNNSATAISFTPKLSFTQSGRVGAGTGWITLLSGTIPANGTAATEYTIPASASYSLVNVNSNFTNNRILVLDKIELAVVSVPPPLPPLLPAVTNLSVIRGK